MIQDSNKLLKEVRQKEGEDDEDLQPDGVINDEIVSMDAYQILKEEFEKLQDQLEEEQNAPLGHPRAHRHGLYIDGTGVQYILYI